MTNEHTGEEHLRQLDHDLRHSLHVIALGLELLKETRQDPERLEEICQSLDVERRQAEKLIDQLIALARQSSAKPA
jgi:signal transduction histidine kinase